MTTSRTAPTLVGVVTALSLSACGGDAKDRDDSDDCFGVECKDSEVCDAEQRACVEAAPKACKKDDDCDVKGGELCSPKDGHCYEKWGCLEDPMDWTSSGASETSFSYKATVRSLTMPDDATALTDISARACRVNDPSCEAPVVSPEMTTVSDQGEVTVPFPDVGTSGWTGTIRVTAELREPTDDELAIVPGYLHFTPENPLVTDVQQQARSVLIDTSTVTTFAQLAGTVDPSQVANLGFFVYDCGGNPAADVTITSSQGRFIPLASETAPDLRGSTTTAYGAGLLVGQPLGFQTFVIRDEKQNELVTDSLSIHAFGDAVNYVHYYPRFSALKKWLDSEKGASGEGQ